MSNSTESTTQNGLRILIVAFAIFGFVCVCLLGWLVFYLLFQNASTKLTARAKRLEEMKKEAYLDCSMMARECCRFRSNTGRFPKKLEDLVQLPTGFTARRWKGPYMSELRGKDPWGNPYRYSISKDRKTVIVSSDGPDRRSNTDDDLIDKCSL